MANIKFSGFTAPGGSFTPARASTYFVGYDNSGGPDNIRLVTSDIETLLNWPEYSMRLQSTTLNPTLEYVQTTSYSYGGAVGTLQFTGGTNVTVTRQSQTELKIDATDTNDTSLPIKNVAGITEFTATDTTGLAIIGSGSVTATYTSGSKRVTLSGTDTNYTYLIDATTSGSDVDLTLKGSGGGSNSTVKFKAGANMTLTRNASDEIEFEATDTNTAYQLVNSTGAGTQCEIELQTLTSTPAGKVVLTPGANVTITNVASNTYAIAAAASTSWTQAADTGSNNAIANGDTLDLAGGTYITTTSSAPSNKLVTIAHDSTTRTDTTSSTSPGGGGTFTVIDTVTTNGTGHVTAANVKTVTMPSAGDTYDFNATAVVGPGGNVSLNLDSTSGTDDSAVQLTAGSNITLTRNSATEITIASSGGGGGGSGLTPTTKTASYTAAAGDFVICDVTGIVVITLPSSPSVGDLVGVKYSSQNAQTDQLRVITPAAGDLIDKVDRSTNWLPVPAVNTYFEFIYGSTNNWFIK